MTIIDAHQHVWDLDRTRYEWLDGADPVLRRSILFEEVLPELRAAGVDGSVLVQATDSDEDTDGMLAVAAQHPEVLGVVGWLPLDDLGRAAARLAHLRRSPVFVGVRSLIHDRPRDDWIVGPPAAAGLRLLEDQGVPFDYVTSSPAALRHLPTIGERFPRLRVVLDHLGKPPIGAGRSALAEWRALLADVAANPATHAKVSGLYAAGADPAAWTPSGVAEVVHDAVSLFGPGRLMYGGDWPVSLTAGGYARCWAAVTGAIADLDAGSRAAILGGTAQRFYRLPG